MRWALALLLVACGDPLTGAEYRGEPVFKIEGQITTIDPLPPELEGASYAISMFWSRGSGAGVAELDLVEQDSVSTEVEFPSSFTLRVFSPPDEAHFGSSDASWVLGLVLVYVDRDGDHRYDLGDGDRLIGGSLRQGLVYAREALEATSSPTRAAVPGGFSVARLPLDRACEPRPPPPRGTAPRPPPNFSCASDGACPPGLSCDPVERICRPQQRFELTLSGRFRIERPFCSY